MQLARAYAPNCLTLALPPSSGIGASVGKFLALTAGANVVQSNSQPTHYVKPYFYFQNFFLNFILFLFLFSIFIFSNFILFFFIFSSIFLFFLIFFKYYFYKVDLCCWEVFLSSQGVVTPLCMLE